ncbi:hypothetical protein [Lyngbya confervoides]|uniref:Uncharacterized protein n=1 Tax=Lyngbya confervoides BDU141951 TaxID=1574623 RepID=A0ABD4T5R7_9CYAN|nr:hypothetical protein [Lyngbya confervoides]MCM1984033.1 hypothetical protein [Lyngbya confervoides BDU141951]
MPPTVIEKLRARYFDERLNQGDYIILLEASEPEIRRAEPSLMRGGIYDWSIYSGAPVSPASSRTLV